jgi:hypothetical protein
MTQASITLHCAHRLNNDGTVDSICRDCYITVTKAYSESDLEPEERDHTCDPALLEHYKKFR